MNVMEDVIMYLFVFVRVILFAGVVWLIVREIRKSGRIKKR
jgi:hypothetical protein